jgi:hypothetical protein
MRRARGRDATIKVKIVWFPHSGIPPLHKTQGWATRQTEMNAYRVTQSIWDAAGKTASYGQCGGGQCLCGPGTNVDATTIMLLANPANGYNHFVDDGNGSYVNQLGLRQLPAVDTPNP